MRWSPRRSSVQTTLHGSTSSTDGTEEELALPPLREDEEEQEQQCNENNNNDYEREHEQHSEGAKDGNQDVLSWLAAWAEGSKRASFSSPPPPLHMEEPLTVRKQRRHAKSVGSAG